jgi:hypothetical protein
MATWIKKTTKPDENGDYICRLIEKNGVQAVKKVEWWNDSDTHKEYWDAYVDEWLDESSVNNSTIVLGEEDSITIAAKHIRIVVKHNDVGISVDFYNDEDDDGLPFREDQIWFTEEI